MKKTSPRDTLGVGMAGLVRLVPAIHVFVSDREDVDTRDPSTPRLRRALSC